MDISQYYQINAIDINSSVIVRRGEGSPTIISGGARYKTVTRPKRTSIILFDGIDPYKMDLPILFDGWASGLSIEFLIARLNQMRFPQAELNRASRIRIDGAVPVKGATWVIEDITWGTNVIYDVVGSDGIRYRQDAIVHLLQFIPEEALAGIKKYSLADQIVTTKAGQTVKALAKGDPKQAKAIQKANGIRDPKTVKPGQTIRVPQIKGSHGGTRD